MSEQPVRPSSPVRMIRLEQDMDRPLFRIFPLWAFEDMLRVQRLVLVPPQYWDDPFEDLPASILMQGPNKQQKQLADYLCTAFCQCWSFESESDSLLRAYSRVRIDKLHRRNADPQNEGVQVQTTARKLAMAMAPWASKGDWGRLYIGRAEYLPQEELAKKVANILATIGPYEIGRGNHRAQSLLLKRKAFAHENEVRLIWICSDRRSASEPLAVNLDPNAFIDNVRFDPRIIEFERRERQERARALGYKGEFSNSMLYQKTLLQTVLPWNWENWEPGSVPSPMPGAIN